MRFTRILQLAAVGVLMAGLVPVTPEVGIAPAQSTGADSTQAADVMSKAGFLEIVSEPRVGWRDQTGGDSSPTRTNRRGDSG